MTHRTTRLVRRAAPLALLGVALTGCDWGPEPPPAYGFDYGRGCADKFAMPCTPVDGQGQPYDGCHGLTAVRVDEHWDTWPETVAGDDWYCVEVEIAPPVGE